MSTKRNPLLGSPDPKKPSAFWAGIIILAIGLGPLVWALGNVTLKVFAEDTTINCAFAFGFLACGLGIAICLAELQKRKEPIWESMEAIAPPIPPGVVVIELQGTDNMLLFEASMQITDLEELERLKEVLQKRFARYGEVTLIQGGRLAAVLKQEWAVGDQKG